MVYFTLDRSFYDEEIKKSAEPKVLIEEVSQASLYDNIAERNHFIYQCKGNQSY